MAELDCLISDQVAKEETGALAAKLLASRIAFGRVNSVAGLSAHGDLRRATIETPAGAVQIPAPPARFGDEDDGSLGPVPAAGEHNDLIRREFVR